MVTIYDAVILGAGAMGSAAAYHMAKSGQHVLVLEQFEIDHQKGSSYGFSRIIRYAYENPTYTRLMKSAYPAWSALAHESGEQLYTRTGGLDFGRTTQPSLQAVLNSLEVEAIPHERWTPAEAERHFPQFSFDADMMVIYQADAGILSASKCVRAHLRLAELYGAQILPNTPVTAITPLRDSIIVQTEHETYSAAYLIITAGSWSQSALKSTGLSLPLTPLQCQEMYFDVDKPGDYEPSRFPTFIGHMTDDYDRAPYGIASHQDSGLKVGFHGGQTIRDPKHITYNPDEAEARRVLEFTTRYLPGVQSVRTARVCLYTMTPDEHFLIDKHPVYPHIVFGGGCSGHSFKFSPLIGSILTELALRGSSEYDISLFRVDRLFNMPDEQRTQVPLQASPHSEQTG